MLADITPIILTLDEAPNIERTLSALSWAKEILVIDSFSQDATRDICSKFNNVVFIQHAFDQFATQWEFAISQNIRTNWVLALDADHVVSTHLSQELAKLVPSEQINGYWISFIYKINGKALRGSLYPPLISLYRPKYVKYWQDGHAQRVSVAGQLAYLNGKIYHDDRKPHRRWKRSQKKYAAQEADKLSMTRWSDLKWADRCRVIGIAPLLVLPYTLIVKGLAVNGFAGWYYAWQRFMAEFYLQLARLNLVITKRA